MLTILLQTFQDVNAKFIMHLTSEASHVTVSLMCYAAWMLLIHQIVAIDSPKQDVPFHTLFSESLTGDNVTIAQASLYF